MPPAPARPSDHELNRYTRGMALVLVTALARAEQLGSGQACYCLTAAYVYRDSSQARCGDRLVGR